MKKTMLSFILIGCLLVCCIGIVHAAIDTQNERRSILRLYDVPSGTVDISSRFSLLGLYNTNTDDAQPLPEPDEDEGGTTRKRVRYSGGLDRR